MKKRGAARSSATTKRHQGKSGSLIVECPSCEARVASGLLYVHDTFDPDNDPAPSRICLLQCSGCRNPLLISQDTFLGAEGWNEPIRLWPSPAKSWSSEIPPIVRRSLGEAGLCYRARAYSACAVMAGRALEGICRHFETKNKFLGGGLKELLDRRVIDGRIYEWSQELHRHRNIGAHASDEIISRDDARDLLEFATAISEYVFVLTARYEEFRTRSEKQRAQRTRRPGG